MFFDPFHLIIPFVDLAALSLMTGAVLCLIWTGCLGKPEDSTNVCFSVCRKLLFFCLIAMMISSVGNLLQRTVEMSGMNFIDAMPFLPTVLFHSHYGAMGLVRAAGIGLALLAWLAGGRYMHTRAFGIVMLCAAAAIAFSRSSTSHAADFGDLSLQELSDWFHFLAAALWGGSVLAIAMTISPSLVADNPGVQHSVAGIADNFYKLFGPVFAILMMSGLYNAWVETGDIGNLFTTTYGLVLSVKLVLAAILTARYIAPPQRGKDETGYAIRFLQRIRVEALFIGGILLCVAVFTHDIPARHAAHMKMMEHEQMDTNHDSGDEMSHHMSHGHGM